MIIPGINYVIKVSIFLLVWTGYSFALESTTSTFNYNYYAAILKNYVNNQGLVNYKELKNNLNKIIITYLKHL